MSRINTIGKSKSYLLLYCLMLSLVAQVIQASELVEVDYRVSKIPVKRAHIHVTESDLRFNGAKIAQEKLLQNLSKLGKSTVYCEVDKLASISSRRVKLWASLVLKSGGRFFYKKHRSAIDSFDHCHEYKQTEQVAAPDR